MMATREVPWATACESPKPIVIVGTKSRPPPIPIVPLRNPRPQHLQRDQHEAAADTEQPSEQPAQKADRQENGLAACAVDYSVVLGGVSGWLVTTEWCRNWAFDGTSAVVCFAFFFFFGSD